MPVLRRPLDPAVVTLTGVAIFLAGFMEQNAYFTALGVPEGSLDFSFHYVTTSSIFALPPLLLVGLAALAAREVRLRRRNNNPFRRKLPVVYVICLASAIAVVETFSLRNGTSREWGGSPIQYWLSIVVTVLLIVLWSAARRTARQPRGLVVATLIVLTLMLFMLSAGFMGMNRAAEAKKGCGYRPFVSFNPPLESVSNGTSWVIVQTGNGFWLRLDNTTDQSQDATFVEIPPSTAVQIEKKWPDRSRCH